MTQETSEWIHGEEYYAIGNIVYKSAKKTRNEDGGATIILGFPVLVLSEYLIDADKRAQEHARMMNCHDDLVEALEKLLEDYCSVMSSEFNYPDDPWEGRPSEARDNARAALAKARGQ